MHDGPDKAHRSDLENDLELYVLGLLTPEEESDIERYLQDHPEAGERLHDLRETSATLATSLDPMTPPSGLKDRILSEARGDDDVSGVESIERPWYSGWRRWAAAAVFLIIFGGLLIWVLQFQLQIENDTTVERQAVEILNPDISASGSILTFEDPNLVVLNLEGLPQPGDQRVYQLWYLKGDVPHPGTTFTPNQDGRVVVPLSGDLSNYQAIAVTVEPSGGSDAPTSDPILLGKLNG